MTLSSAVFNPFGIQLLPNAIRQKLFGNLCKVKPCQESIQRAEAHLELFNLNFNNKDKTPASFPEFEIPDLEGVDVSAHFEAIAGRKVKPYLSAVDELFSSERYMRMPSRWLMTPGWTKYRFDGSVAGEGPSEKCVVFDVEVCVKFGHQPILATALTRKAWYGWCSPILFQECPVTEKVIKPSELIPFEESPLLVIGHNVGYDRARIKGEYSLQSFERTRFLDTMSLHITVSGMTSEQRALKAKHDSSLNSPWMAETSMNNLADVYNLYCPDNKGLKKSIRSVFVQGTLHDVKSDFQNLMSYCAQDTDATFKLAKKLFPLFKERCPHPAAFFGMLEFGNMYLPTDDSWFQYISQSDDVANELTDEVRQVLEQHAKESCQLLREDKFKKDPWMWDQDWSTPGLRKKKGSFIIKIPEEETNLDEKFKHLIGTKKLLYKAQPRKPGYPMWFQDLRPRYRDEDWSEDITDLGPGKSIVPLLLRLTWRGYPLHRHKDEKWGYIYRGKSKVSEIAESIPEYISNSTKRDSIPIVGGVFFTRLPHKDGPDKRVGNPLAKDFMDKVSDGSLSTSSASKNLAHRVLLSSKIMSYWKSSRDRIVSQILGQDPETEAYAILPQSIASGTLTRRAVEKTWLTASNAKPDRIGSELKTLVRSPEGYHIVGADVDSQELWIASLLGDASFIGDHGCTALGWMNLQGSKNEGTDMHSTTAKVAGVSRDQAKILNYGRIYGAGMKFAKMLLQNFNPSLTDFQAADSAKQMYEKTKGQRQYCLNFSGAICYASSMHQASDPFQYIGIPVDEKLARKLAKFYKYMSQFMSLSSDNSYWQISPKGQTSIPNTNLEGEMPLEEGIEFLRNLFMKTNGVRSFTSISLSELQAISSKTVWNGGSESYTFNRLEEIALGDTRTPVLKNQISRVLQTNRVGKDFLRSRVNWVVQSSGVDYMHLLILAMDWLLEDVFKISHKARFLISIHDEVRYIVKSEDRYIVAYALHLSNLLVRAVFCNEVGIKDLPLSVAFFSGVDVDKVIRKDPSNESFTPSNPQGIYLGYGVSPGECLTFEETLKKIPEHVYMFN